MYMVHLQVIIVAYLPLQALVWHVKTLPPDLRDEIKAPSDPNFET